MMSVSTFRARFRITMIFDETFAPPMIATNGLRGSSRDLPIISSSFRIKKPQTPGRMRATPSVEAWARCAVPKASFT